MCLDLGQVMVKVNIYSAGAKRDRHVVFLPQILRFRATADGVAESI
jgi:hypothetical protein